MSYNMFRLKYIRSLINMGWYHVDRTGKGVMLNFLDCTEDLIERLAINSDLYNSQICLFMKRVC